MSSGGVGHFKSINEKQYFMKNSLLLHLLLLFTGLFSSRISAQQPGATSEFQKVKSKVWITMIGDDRQVESLYTQKGTLYRTGDSLLFFAKTATIYYPNVTPMEVIPIEKIWEIQARKRGHVKTGGMLLGAALGMLIGGVAGYRNGKPDIFAGSDSAYGKAITGAFAGIPIGIALGAVASTFMRQTFTIKGKRDSYAAQREKLKRLSITSQ